MKYSFITIFLFLIIISDIYAGTDPYIISQKKSIKIMPLYQSWTFMEQSKVAEISIPLLLYFPMGRNLNISLRGSQAKISGDVTSLSGITDTQLAVSYYLEAANLIFNVGLNFPNGKKELTAEEFRTSALLSLNHLNFQVPNLGQGLNVSPGLSWALPLGDNFVVGIGASYQYREKFKPIEDMLDEYEPGDEILFTGGFDLQLSETTAFTGDIIYTTYGADKIGSDTVFISGNKIQLNLQLISYFNYNNILLSGRYRSSAKNSLVLGEILQEETEHTTPDQIEVQGLFNIRLSRSFYTGIIAEGRFYKETPVFAGINIFALGMAPEISLSSNFKIPMRFKYLFGKYKDGSNISGLEIGMGLSLIF